MSRAPAAASQRGPRRRPREPNVNPLADQGAPKRSATELIERLERQSTQLRNIEDSVARMDPYSDELARQIAVTQDEIRQGDNFLVASTQENAALKQQLAQIRNELNDAKQQIESANSQVVRQAGEIKEYEREVAEYEREVADFQSINADDISEIIDRIDDRIVNLNVQISKLQQYSTLYVYSMIHTKVMATLKKPETMNTYKTIYAIYNNTITSETTRLNAMIVEWRRLAAANDISNEQRTFYNSKVAQYTRVVGAISQMSVLPFLYDPKIQKLIFVKEQQYVTYSQNQRLSIQSFYCATRLNERDLFNYFTGSRPDYVSTPMYRYLIGETNISTMMETFFQSPNSPNMFQSEYLVNALNMVLDKLNLQVTMFAEYDKANPGLVQSFERATQRDIKLLSDNIENLCKHTGETNQYVITPNALKNEIVATITRGVIHESNSISGYIIHTKGNYIDVHGIILARNLANIDRALKPVIQRRLYLGDNFPAQAHPYTIEPYTNRAESERALDITYVCGGTEKGAGVGVIPRLIKEKTPRYMGRILIIYLLLAQMTSNKYNAVILDVVGSIRRLGRPGFSENPPDPNLVKYYHEKFQFQRCDNMEVFQPPADMSDVRVPQASFDEIKNIFVDDQNNNYQPYQILNAEEYKDQFVPMYRPYPTIREIHVWLFELIRDMDEYYNNVPKPPIPPSTYRAPAVQAAQQAPVYDQDEEFAPMSI